MRSFSLAHQRRRRPPSVMISKSDISMCLGISLSLRGYARMSDRKGGQFIGASNARWPDVGASGVVILMAASSALVEAQGYTGRDYQKGSIRNLETGRRQFFHQRLAPSKGVLQAKLVPTGLPFNRVGMGNGTKLVLTRPCC